MVSKSNKKATAKRPPLKVTLELAIMDSEALVTYFKDLNSYVKNGPRSYRNLYRSQMVDVTNAHYMRYGTHIKISGVVA